jgi:hypothetical protein
MAAAPMVQNFSTSYASPLSRSSTTRTRSNLLYNIYIKKEITAFMQGRLEARQLTYKWSVAAPGWHRIGVAAEEGLPCRAARERGWNEGFGRRRRGASGGFALAGGSAGVVSRGGVLGAAGSEPETRASCRAQCASDPGTGWNHSGVRSTSRVFYFI